MATKATARTRKRQWGKPWLGKRGREHPRSRPVITPAGRFESLSLAADFYRTTPGTIWQRVNWGTPGYRYAKLRR